MNEIFKKAMDALEELAYLETNPYKSRAYKTAKSVLEDKGEESFLRRNHYADIPGIGRSIESKLLEFKKNGYIEKLNKLRMENPGKLNPKYFKVRKSYVTKRILLKDAMNLYNDIVSQFNLKDAEYSVAGSVRRQVPLVGDIDIVLTTEDKNALHKIKSSLDSKYKVTVSGDKKMSFIADFSNMTPVDIYITSRSEYYYCLLFLTGSRNFNIKMRATAKSKGFTLNQYTMTDKSGKSYPVNSEDEIFNLIGMQYVPPTKRNI